MAGEIKRILERSLQDIDEKSLKSFKSKLNETQLDGLESIPRDMITGKNAEELVDVIWRHYTVEQAPGLIVSLLQKINERQVSLDLQSKLKKMNLIFNIEKTPGKGLLLASPLKDRTNLAFSAMSHQRHRNGHERHPSSCSPDSSHNSATEELPVPQRKSTAKKSLKMGRRPTTERGKPLPYIRLKPLTEDDITHMKEEHKDKPHVYARLLFQHFVPFERLKMWAAEKTNFDGYGGKRAIPKNLLDAIMKEVRKEFQPLKPEDKKEIKNKLNYVLKNPPKTGWSRQF